MIRSIAFDVSDTLYPTGKPKLFLAFRLAEQKILMENGFDISAEKYWPAVERTSREIQSNEWKNNPLRFPIVLLKNLGIEQDGLAMKIGLEFSKVHNAYKKNTPFLLLDIKELIPKIASKKIILSIISDTDTSWSREQLKRDGIYQYFKFIILSNELGLGKGSGKPFELFLEEMSKLEINPNECLMIGDLSVDMDAKKFGIKTVLYNPDNVPFSHFTYKPDYVIEKYDELKEIIEKENNYLLT